MTGRLGGDGARFTSDITLFVHFSLFITDQLSYIGIALSSEARHDRASLIVKACPLPPIDRRHFGVASKQSKTLEDVSSTRAKLKRFVPLGIVGGFTDPSREAKPF